MRWGYSRTASSRSRRSPPSTATDESEEAALITEDQVKAAVAAKRVADAARDAIIAEMISEKPQTVTEQQVAALRGK